MVYSLSELPMDRHITLSQCVQLWWRFALYFIGTLLLCSLVTHVSLWLSAAASQWLTTHEWISDNDMTAAPYVGHIYTFFMHALGLGSIAFFVAAQVSVFYILLNHNATVRHILFGKRKNPYSAPSHRATRPLLGR